MLRSEKMISVESQSDWWLGLVRDYTRGVNLLINDANLNRCQTYICNNTVVSAIARDQSEHYTGSHGIDNHAILQLGHWESD